MVLPPVLHSRFEVLGELGRGGFATVLEVRDRDLGRVFALKLVDPGEDPRRTRREIRTSVGLVHPHVIRCFEGDVLGEVGYLLLERADGSLGDWIHGPERIEEVWRALRESCAGVAALHAQGLVHRDLKPSNVMRTERGAKIADLGLTTGSALETLTRTGVILGTPGYLAPEQARGERPTPAVDVFAMGVLYYQVVEGRLPYASEDPARMLGEVARGELRPLERAHQLLSGEAVATLRAALASEPRARPADVRELSDALREPPVEGAVGRGGPHPVALETPAGRRPPGAPLGPRSTLRPRRSGPVSSRRPRGSRRRRGILGVLLVVLGAAAVVALLRDPGETRGGEGARRDEEPRRFGPFSPRLLGALEEELRRAQGMVLAPDGSLTGLPARGGLPEGARELLDPDPALWPRRLRELPALGRVLGWAAGGGDERTLPGWVLRALREVGERYRSQGLEDPLAHLTMPVGEPDPEACARASWYLGFEEACPPHLAAALGLEARIRAETDAVYEAFRTGVSRSGSDVLEGLYEAHRLRGRFADKGPTVTVRESFLHPPARRALPRELGALPGALGASLRRVLRVAREHPEEAEVAALMGGALLAWYDLGVYSYLSFLPPESLVGQAPPGPMRSPPVAFVLARLRFATLLARRQSAAVRDGPAAWEELEALCWEAASPSSARGARMRVAESLEMMLNFPDDFVPWGALRERLERGWADGTVYPTDAEVRLLVRVLRGLVERGGAPEGWGPFLEGLAQRLGDLRPFASEDEVRVLDQRLPRLRSTLGF